MPKPTTKRRPAPDAQDLDRLAHALAAVLESAWRRRKAAEVESE